MNEVPESVNHSTICKLFNRAMFLLWPEGMWYTSHIASCDRGHEIKISSVGCSMSRTKNFINAATCKMHLITSNGSWCSTAPRTHHHKGGGNMDWCYNLILPPISGAEDTADSMNTKDERVN
jgi:hypothetical protein